MNDFLVRAETREAWLAYAQEQGWLVEFEGNLYPANHVRVDELGPVVVTPGVYDPETMEEVTPPVMDDWHHVNLRVVEIQLDENGDVMTPFADVFADGRAVVTEQDVRAIEAGEAGSTIQVLMPVDIETPIRIWADGMHHAELPMDTLPAAKKTAKKAKKK